MTVLEKFELWMKETGTSQNVAAKRIGISPASLSLWRKGQYPANEAGLENRVEQFLALEAEREAETYPRPRVDYVKTRQSYEIMAIIGLAHRRHRMAIASGPSGIGKTTSINEYCKRHTSAHRVHCWPGMSRPAMVAEMLRQLVAEPQISPSWEDNLTQVVRLCMGSEHIFLLDEAQNVDFPKAEVLRYIHDRTGISIVLIGTGEILERMNEGKKRARLWAQTASRSRMDEVAAAISREDVTAIISAWVDNPGRDVLDFAYTEAQQLGAYRHLVKLVEDGISIQRASGANELTAEHLRTALAVG